MSLGVTVAKGTGSYLTTEYISQGQRAVRLYKLLCTTLRENAKRPPSNFVFTDPLAVRIGMLKVREAFEENKNLSQEESLKLIEEWEEKAVWARKVKPFKYPFSPGGSCYGRTEHVADYIVDNWHPLEKARYPKYFAQREIMKEEHIKWWNKKYGKDDSPV